MTTFKTILLAAMGVAIAGSAASGAFAETRLHPAHAARAEVNHRLAAQNHRIRVLRREGVISPHKAAILHRQVRMIRREERIDARFDRGHITPREHQVLNHQENQVDRNIIR